MKVFKTIASIFIGVVMIPLILISIFFGLYNLVPGIKELTITSTIYNFIISILGITGAFPLWLGILIPVIAFIAVIGFVSITWKSKSIFTNIFITILKWLSVIVIIGTPIATVAMQMLEAAKANQFGTQVLQNLTVQLTSVNFIVLTIFLIGYILVKIFGNKVTGDLNRALTAARTAKELGQPGRTPDILLNIYKMINFIFPELLVLGMFIALFINTSLAVYFWSLIAGLLIFMFLNIWMDINIRREAKRKILADKVNQTKAIEQIIKGAK